MSDSNIRFTSPHPPQGFTSLGPSENEQNKSKLSTMEVFDRIRPLLCSLNSTLGEFSGFFLDKETILTATHSIPFNSEDRLFAMEYVQVSYPQQEKPYFPEPSDGIIKDHAVELDVFSMKSEAQLEKEEVDPIKLLPDDLFLQEGMKVYFAGYPLGQGKATFHKGIVSSISEDRGTRRFTIDGTVVPGNSGGPVVTQFDGKVYLVGVITAEVADFTPEDRKTIAIMQALKNKRNESPNTNAPLISVGRMSLGNDGITNSINIRTNQGPETIKLNDMDVIHLALDLIQRNMSTGIGKAVDIRHYGNLFKEEPKLEIEDKQDFLVGGKGKALIAKTVNTEIEKNGKPEQVGLVKYCEVRYGNSGGGNRGIRFFLLPALGKGVIRYKFSPNPHNASGNYNKNREELYDKATAAFLIAYQGKDDEYPTEFSFQACQTEYEAIMDQ